jgi:hypothetical protein
MKKERLNFAKIPFINYKIPSIVLTVMAVLAIGGLLLNIVLAILNGGNFIKQKRILKEESQTTESLNKRLKDAETMLSAKEINSLTGEALFLDGILKQKKFSWETFLERLETVKPFKSVFTSITPKPMNDNNYLVKIEGLAQPRSEIFKFEENIFKSEYFGKPYLQSEGIDKASTWQTFDIIFVYYPEGKK